MLTLNNISLRFGETRVLNQVSSTFEQGKLIGLIGPNGAGKSSLLRIMAQLQKPDSGTLLLDGVDMVHYDSNELAKRITYLPQTGVCHWPLTVERLVSLGRFPHQTNLNLSAADHQAIIQAIEQTDTAHLIGRTVDTLSGGEKARVMLARALATKTGILLADEPIVALDPRHQIDVMSLLQKLAQQGKTVIVVVHELHLAMRYCDELILMNNGKVITKGQPKSVLSKSNVKEIYSVDALFGEHQRTPWIIPWLDTKKEA